MKTAAILVVGAISAVPATAGTRVRASLDVSYTPAAKKPVGFGLSVDAIVESQPPTIAVVPRPGLPGTQVKAELFGGAGARLDVFLDGSVQFIVEPIVGSTLIQPTEDWGCLQHFRPLLFADARPGFAIRSHGGPAITVAANLEGTPGRTPLSLRGRAGGAFALNADPSRAARADGPLQDGTFSFGTGLTHQVFGNCNIRRSIVMDGRPLREEESIVRPDYDHRPTNPLAADWLDQAQDEHAAVAAFLRLAAELELVGAPTDLVRECHQAAHDEAEHARLCLERAAHHEGRGVQLSELRTSIRDFGHRDEALRTLAAESWIDGAINEGLAALEALAKSIEAVDPTDKVVHYKIAVEEQAHAELGARIAAWCAEELAAS